MRKLTERVDFKDMIIQKNDTLWQLSKGIRCAGFILYILGNRDVGYLLELHLTENSVNIQSGQFFKCVQMPIGTLIDLIGIDKRATLIK